MKSSEIFTLKWRDAAKGFITAFFSATLTAVYQMINNHTGFTWENIKPALLVGLGAGIAYLLKNFFTNSQDQFAGLGKPVQPIEPVADRPPVKPPNP